MAKRSAATLWLVAGLSGCGASGSDGDGTERGGVDPVEVDGSATELESTSSVSGASGDATTAADPGGPASSAAGDAPGGSVAEAPSDELGLEGRDVASGGLPCEVKQTLERNCVRCHAETPQFGAPMPLVRYEDLMAPAVSAPDRSVYELVLERVQSDDRPMPPVPNDRLSSDEIEQIDDWVGGGAGPIAEADACEAFTGAPPGDGSFINEFPDPSRCDVSLEFLANDSGGAGAFTVPQEDDHYQCFYFKGPTDPVQLLGFRPIVDDSRVLHHWLLYATNNAALEDGTSESCTGIHPDDLLLGGWAPGGTAYGMPDGVGLEVPSGDDAVFILEIHYNNVARLTDAADRSGVQLCATRQPQRETAAVHWLGTENIFLLPGQSEAGSTCRPNLTEPVNLISVTPHMHELGVHSRMEITRADGTREMLLDEPFDFNTQVGYETPAVLMPGDSITATCVWNNTSGGLTTFGEGTSDEMCYLFTLAYPAGALDTGGDFLLGGLLGGENKCMN